MELGIDLDELNLGAAIMEELGFDPDEELKKEAQEANTEKGVKVYARRYDPGHIQYERRIKSELHLEQELEWHFKDGDSYHCISQGDVDSLTYLRAVIKQQRVKYAVLSTWCMALTDAAEIKEWLDKDYLGRIDFYVGEIFQGSYSDVYKYIAENCISPEGRICVFRNHSKVMAGFGEHFDFAIESSANVNTNPRCENACITVDTNLARFYKDFYDGIQSFNREYDAWKPYEIQ